MDTNTIEIKSQTANIYWDMLKGLSTEIKLELIARLSSSLLKKEEHVTGTNWTDSFAGKWQDDRDADEMVEDIRKSRSFNRDIEL